MAAAAAAVPARPTPSGLRIPTFSGVTRHASAGGVLTIEKFQVVAEIQFIANAIPVNDRPAHLAGFLSGAALDCYLATVQREQAAGRPVALQVIWNDLIALFHVDADLPLMRQRLQQVQHRGGSIEAFHTEFLASYHAFAAAGGQMAVAELVFLFVSNLAPRISAKAFSRRPDDMAEALQFALDAEEELRADQRGSSLAHQREHGNPGRAQRVDQRHGQHDRSLAPRPDRAPSRDVDVVCHYCGIRGHLQRDCRRRQREQQPHTPQRGGDHRAGLGGQRPGGGAQQQQPRQHGALHAVMDSAPPTATPSTVRQQQRDGTSMIVVSANVNGHELQALVDTGASISLLSPAAAELVLQPQQRPTAPGRHVVVAGASSQQQTRGATAPLPVIVGTTGLVLPLNIFETGAFACILGQDFLAATGASIDCRRGALTFTAAPVIGLGSKPRAASATDHAATLVALGDMPEYSPLPGELAPNSFHFDPPTVIVDAVADSDSVFPLSNHASASAQQPKMALSVAPHDSAVEQPDFAEVDGIVETDFLGKSPAGLRALLAPRLAAFAFSSSQLASAARLPEMAIILQPNTSAIYTPQYRLAQTELNFVEAELAEMLANGIIEPSSSPWNSALLVIPKSNGKLRLCVDFRRLNAVTIPDASPVPLVDAILDRLGSSSRDLYASKLDLTSGFWQLELEASSRGYTAFSSPTGHYQWRRVPMGLVNAPAVFNQRMVLAFGTMPFVHVYFDDVIIAAPTQEEHDTALAAVLDRALQLSLVFNPAKCVFLAAELPVLGFLLTRHGLATDPAKTDALRERVPPTTVKELQTFLGLAGYYRRFVRNFADIAAPLYELTHKDSIWAWKQPQQDAFRALCKSLTEAPVLQLPNWEQPFIVFTDASGVALGAILAQSDAHGRDHPLHYASRLLGQTERHYSITELECLAIVWAVHLFRPYLYGRRFTVVTDHGALTWLFSLKQSTGRLARWALYLQAFDFIIVYRKGSQHQNVDALSRPVVIEQRETPQQAMALTRAASRAAAAGHAPPDRSPLPSTVSDPTASSGQRSSGMVRHTGHPRIPADFPIGTELEEEAELSGKLDPVENPALLHYLKHRRFRDAETKSTVRNVKKLAQVYSLAPSGALLFQLPDGSTRVTPPVADREDIVRRAHLTGHFQVQATLDRVAAEYHWPRMAALVQRVVHQCEACLRTREGPDVNHPARVTTPATELFQRVAVDLVFGFPPTERGNVGIMVLTDYLSRFPMVYAIQTKTAVEIATNLLNFISLFGPPQELLSDNGKEFCNNLVDELSKLAGVERVVTSPYHPRTNGLVERLNGSLVTSLRAHVLNRPHDWDLMLDFVAFAYRTKVNATTGHTPYELVFGRPPPTFSAASDDAQQPSPVGDNPLTARLQQIQQLISDTRPAATERLITRQAAQRKGQDRQHRVTVEVLQAGQQVWTHVGPRPNKLGPRYNGPYRVVRRTTGGNYILRTATGLVLKRSVPRDHIKLSEEEVPDPAEADLYDVEEILESRLRRGKIQYLVKWADYPLSEATWEPESSFVDLTPIHNYWQTQSEAAAADAVV